MRLSCAVLGLLAMPGLVTAQLAERVAEIEDGRVRFGYATRPGVEICDQGVRIGEHHMQWHMDDRYPDPRDCRVGSAELELVVRDGLVTDVEIVRGSDPADRGVVDLGRVEPEAAADFLVSLPYRGATANGAEEAIFPAMIADGERPWAALVEIARDRALHEGVRKNALFWLGQEAADAATDELSDVAMDESEDQEIRNAAVFALSQRPADEAIPVLMEVARSGEAAETRRTAMFWLAQSDDERVVRFFEDILLGRRR